ncbi:riboflavin biosynthesis pyrimidine reductase [Kribbella sp. VKM Ac-2571]|uniref:dihydrofolate reductase family protein n=1 Tax=Kribbella sp. VKM Ac-2571 TaxID=2512222 RepID=UPI00105ED72E|nr:dihydrofolate reductase family protein [Kribbella sp. VKM Ac-2571]TDO69392.1 riboflavin biosynthesis pyrimidine reductase [Kribbella sp. VKM Ac-2571]
MRPHVVAQLAVSLDGVTSGFDVDLARFYALASLWQEDVTLIDAGTILAQENAVLAAPRRGPRAEGPLLAVVDERARVRSWDSLRELGYWSGVLALYADQTPERPPDATTRELITGYDQVDLVEVLEVLGRRGVQTVRVDSHAVLRTCLGLDLVDELALLVHPVLIGGEPWYDVHCLNLRHAGTEVFKDGVVWIRYCVAT